MHYTYLLKCKDNSLYCGYTNNLEKRLKVHNKGKASKYTRARLPVELVYYEEYEDKSSAMSREYKIKRLPVTKKWELVRSFKNNKECWPNLAGKQS